MVEELAQRGRQFLECLRHERERAQESRQALRAAIESLQRGLKRSTSGNASSNSGTEAETDRELQSASKNAQLGITNPMSKTEDRMRSLESKEAPQAQGSIQDDISEPAAMQTSEIEAVHRLANPSEAAAAAADAATAAAATVVAALASAPSEVKSLPNSETADAAAAEADFGGQLVSVDLAVVAALASAENAPLGVKNLPKSETIPGEQRMANSPKRSASTSLQRPSPVKRRHSSSGSSSSSLRSCSQSVASVKQQQQQQDEDASGKPMFSGIRALFVSGGERDARIQIWRNKFREFGGDACDLKKPLSNLTHVLAANMKFVESLPAKLRVGDSCCLSYQWVQECLMAGHLVSSGEYQLRDEAKLVDVPKPPPEVAAQPQEAVAKNNADDAREGAQENAQDEYSSDEDEAPGNLTDLRRRRRNFYAKQDSPNFNKHLTDLLTEMWHLYEDVLGDNWRSVAYRRAATKLRSLPFRVRYAEDVSSLQGIGKTMEHCIKEILGTGRLQKLEELSGKPEVVAIQRFASVWGIGAVQAREFHKKGYTSIQDLANEASLSSMARLGLKYYDDFSLRIPRDEVAELEKHVQGIVHAFLPGAWVNAAGSYRRGAKDCGDVDILITHPDGSSHHGLLAEILRRLRSAGFVVDGTDVGSKDVSKGGNQPDIFLGICRLQGCPFRRIDIKVYPRNVYSFALLAFTGNDVLNRKIRFLARMKGYKLSDQGLFVRESRKKGALASTESVVCETERDIFEKLGLEYPEPHDRNW